METFERFNSLGYKSHLGAAFALRLALVLYGGYQDQVSSVPYTDVDYKVFTDAARHIINHESPYKRHTYRYSPLVAILNIPNVILHPCFGKVVFCLVDILVALLIKTIVKNVLNKYKQHIGIKRDKIPQISNTRAKKNKRRATDATGTLANTAMLVWLYNPLTIAIATRGNCDSIAALLVLATLYFLQCPQKCFVAGLIHGVSIHFRLYPIMYSLAFYLYLSDYSYYLTDRKRQMGGASSVVLRANNKKTIFKKEYLLYLVPNFDQIRLVQGCILSLFSLVGLFYWLYGYQFIYETYVFHLVRKDTRHNFSLFFYLHYLTAWIRNVGVWQKVLVVFPQIVLILVLSFRYGLNKFALNFSVLTQTIVMVAYNSVLTSQYFVWVLAVFPLCLWQIKITRYNAAFLLVVWFAAQGAWLLPAYYLEFHGQNTFLFIWIQGVSFFCANIAILGRLIMNFMPPKGI